MPIWTTLSQAAAPIKRADPASVLILVMVFIGLVIALGLIIMLVRRRLLSPSMGDDASMGILASLKAARDRGDMSQEEYEQAKRVLATRAKERILARQSRDGIEPPRQDSKPASTSPRTHTDVEALRRRAANKRDEPSPDNVRDSGPESDAS
jgi:hypothetical protein